MGFGPPPLPGPLRPPGRRGGEPPTLVEFRIEPTKAGTLLTVVESGFDRIPLARRAEAFRMNSNGWAQQIKPLEDHVSQTP